MTSSTTSTSAPRWIAPAVVAGFVLVGWVAIFGLYKFKPTIGTLFLGLAWTSIIVFGLLATRAVQAVVGGAAVIAEDGKDDRRRQELEREKRLLLKAIKEVEFDRDTGKLDEADAKIAVGRYRERALEIISILDDRDRPITQRIDEELKKRLARAEKAAEKAAEKKAEDKKAADDKKADDKKADDKKADDKKADDKQADDQKADDQAAEAAAKKPGPCEGCGLENDADATFCKRCGKKVAA